MIDGLPTIFAAIDDNAVAVVCELQVARQVADCQPQMPQQSGVVIGEVIDRLNWFFGNNQDMRWRLWRNIMRRSFAG